MPMPARGLSRSLAALAALAGAGTLAPAQPADPAKEPPKSSSKDPAQEPRTSDPGISDVLRTQRRTPAEPKPVMPTLAPGAPVPALGAPADGSVAARRFYPEGTFLNRRVGTLVKTNAGDVIFIPERSANARSEPAVALLPCQTLERIEVLQHAFAPTSRAVVSGQVFVYYDRSYMLPTLISIETRTDKPESKPRPTPDAKPGAPSNATPGSAPGSTAGDKPADKARPVDANDPNVAELIQELEGKRGPARVPDAAVITSLAPSPQDKPADKPGEVAGRPQDKAAKPAPEAPLTTDGSVVFNRRGRVIRLATGALAVAFDGDADSPATGAMMMLRCRTLQRLEDFLAKTGDSGPVNVSGRVFTHKGRNYLLPTLVQSAAPSDVKPLQ